MIDPPQDFTERPTRRRPRSQMPRDRRTSLRALARDENAAAARRLVACTRTARTRAAELRAAGHHADLVHAMAASEVARALTCSQQVAETYIGIGAMLMDRTPRSARPSCPAMSIIAGWPRSREPCGMQPARSSGRSKRRRWRRPAR